MTRFSEINRKHTENYRSHFQRHHLIPLQVATIADVISPLNEALPGGFDFDDFSKNGVLLPSDEKTAVETGHPLHRGPHPRYNELVIDRLILITRLSEQIKGKGQRAEFFGFRVRLLQQTLKQALIGRGLGRLRLNKRDPGPSSKAFSNLDASVDRLYQATQWPPLR
jgi:hypothetical protein